MLFLSTQQTLYPSPFTERGRHDERARERVRARDGESERESESACRERGLPWSTCRAENPVQKAQHLGVGVHLGRGGADAGTFYGGRPFSAAKLMDLYRKASMPSEESHHARVLEVVGPSEGNGANGQLSRNFKAMRILQKPTNVHTYASL